MAESIRRTAGRGRLSAIDLLPEAASEAIAWAAAELAENKRTQTDIYMEFCGRLEDVRSRLGLDFTTPSPSAFNRYSLRLAAMTRRMDETRRIAATISERFDAEASDDLTLMAAECLKTLVWELLQSSGEAGISPKGALELAGALRHAAAAQSVSSERRRKIEAEFAAQAKQAVETVAKARGLSADTVDAIKATILGVQA